MKLKHGKFMLAKTANGWYEAQFHKIIIESNIAACNSDSNLTVLLF